MTDIQPMEFSGSDGRPVRGDLHPAEDPWAPWIVICHGFKGFKDWGFFPPLAARIHQEGLNVLRINFSHNGVVASDFDDLDAFERDTWTRHQDDITAVIEEIGADVMGIVGHSRGGSDGVIAGATDARVRGVCALAPLADASRHPADLAEKLDALGHYPFENSRTGQLMRVGKEYFEDSSRYDIVDHASRMRDRPLLVIHGDRDESVPIADGRALVEAHGDARLEVIEGVGHTFGAVHPFAGMNDALERVFELTATWCKENIV